MTKELYSISHNKLHGKESEIYIYVCVCACV